MPRYPRVGINIIRIAFPFSSFLFHYIYIYIYIYGRKMNMFDSFYDLRHNNDYP